MNLKKLFYQRTIFYCIENQITTSRLMSAAKKVNSQIVLIVTN